VSARRPLLTATAAGAMLFALWFVPSANATVEEGKESAQSRAESGFPADKAQTQEQPQAQAQGGHDSQGSRRGSQGQGQDLYLADTGSVDTAPYLVGGTAFLGFGAALVAVATRRSRTTAL
jgi:hypothetical protein